MGRPKGSTNAKKAVASEPKMSIIPMYTSLRDDFIRDISVGLMYELTRHTGKINNDYPDIVVDRATALADKLGIGVEVKKPTRKSAILINPVEEYEAELDSK